LVIPYLTHGFEIRHTNTAKGNIQWIGDDISYAGIRSRKSKVASMVLLFDDLIMVKMSSDGEEAELSADRLG
jgi:hypothetical protein